MYRKPVNFVPLTERITDDRVPLLGAWVARAARLITAEFGGQVDERLLAEP